MLVKTWAVWTTKQGVEAVIDADALTGALNRVPGLKAEPPRRWPVDHFRNKPVSLVLP